MQKRDDSSLIAAAFLVLALFAPGSAWAADAAEVGKNLETMAGLVPTIVFIIGATMITMAIFELAKLASGRSKHTIGPIITVILIGSLFANVDALLVAGGMTLDNGMQQTTMLSYDKMFSFAGASGIKGCGQEAVALVLLWVQVIGIFGFVKGWLLVKDASEGKNASYQNGITFIIGGVLAANIQPTIGVLRGFFTVDPIGSLVGMASCTV